MAPSVSRVATSLDAGATHLALGRLLPPSPGSMLRVTSTHRRITVMSTAEQRATLAAPIAAAVLAAEWQRDGPMRQERTRTLPSRQWQLQKRSRMRLHVQ